MGIDQQRLVKGSGHPRVPTSLGDLVIRNPGHRFQQFCVVAVGRHEKRADGRVLDIVIFLDFGVEPRHQRACHVPVLVGFERPLPLPVVEAENLAEQIVADGAVVEQIDDALPVREKRQTPQQRVRIDMGGVIALQLHKIDDRYALFVLFVAVGLFQRIDQSSHNDQRDRFVLFVPGPFGTQLVEKKRDILFAHRLRLSQKKNLFPPQSGYDILQFHHQKGFSIFSSIHFCAPVLRSFRAKSAAVKPI